MARATCARRTVVLASAERERVPLSGEPELRRPSEPERGLTRVDHPVEAAIPHRTTTVPPASIRTRRRGRRPELGVGIRHETDLAFQIPTLPLMSTDPSKHLLHPYGW